MCELDIVPEKIEKLNSFIDPIQDDEIELFLFEEKVGKRELKHKVTLDVADAYACLRLIPCAEFRFCVGIDPCWIWMIGR